MQHVQSSELQAAAEGILKSGKFGVSDAKLEDLLKDEFGIPFQWLQKKSTMVLIQVQRGHSFTAEVFY